MYKQYNFDSQIILKLLLQAQGTSTRENIE